MKIPGRCVSTFLAIQVCIFAACGEVETDLGTPLVLVTGTWHQCMLTDLGQVRCHGDNLVGQIGNGQSYETSNNEPTIGWDLVDLANVEAIAAFSESTCALANGGLYCWGSAEYLGSGREVEQCRVDAFDAPDASKPCWRTPHRIADVPSGVEIQLTERSAAIGRSDGPPMFIGALEAESAEGLSSDGSLVENDDLSCWIDVNQQRVCTGDDLLFRAEALTHLPPLYPIRAGDFFACGMGSVDGNSYAYCWGSSNELGQLGGPSSDPPLPGEFTNVAVDVVDLCIGTASGCALVDGEVFCWGDNAYGQMGVVPPDPSGGASDNPDMCALRGCQRLPAELSLDAEVRQLVCSETTFCVLTASSDVFCWGRSVEPGPPQRVYSHGT